MYKKYLVTSGIIWAACFVAFLLAYMFVFGPQKKTRKLIEARLTEKKQVYESAFRSAQKETKNQLNEQIEQLRDRLNDFIVDFDDSANLTFEISQIANEKKVVSFGIKGNDNSVRLGESENKYIIENQIVINFIGGFNQFATFLSAMERHRPVLLVDKFTIARSAQNDEAFRVNLSLAALIRKQQEIKIPNKNSTQIYGAKI